MSGSLRPPTWWERIAKKVRGRWPDSYVAARLGYADTVARCGRYLTRKEALVTPPNMPKVPLVKRLADALEEAAGRYGPATDLQRNRWMRLVLEARKEEEHHD